METKTQKNQTMKQANKDKATHTLNFITQEIKGKFIMLPQFIYSSNGELNEAIKLDMETDACLKDCFEGYENLFQSGDYYEELFNDVVFSDEMYHLVTVMWSYSELMDDGNEEAGINLMTMLFRIYQKTGNLKKRYYFELNKMIRI